MDEGPHYDSMYVRQLERNGLVTPTVDQFTRPTADLHLDLGKIV